jgi:hypothetical protein
MRTKTIIGLFLGACGLLSSGAHSTPGEAESGLSEYETRASGLLLERDVVNARPIAELVSIVPRAPAGLSARFNPTHLGAAMKNGDGGSFIQADTEAQCTTHNGMFWNWQRRMVQYSMLSNLVYFSDSDVRRLSAERDKLISLKAASAETAHKTFILSSIEMRGSDLRIGVIQDKLDALEVHISTVKSRFLASRNLVLRKDLFKAFLSASNLTQARLDNMGFYAEIYSQGEETLIVFRGSTELNGWKTNAAQIFSMPRLLDNGTTNGEGAAGQYEIADRLVRFVIASGIPRDRVYVTGHSLGGGLAAYAHLSNDTAGALLFNAAQLGVGTRAKVTQQPHFEQAQLRMANYISYLKGTSAADPVSQGTELIKGILAGLHVSVASYGKLFGAKYYLPILPGPIPAGWLKGAVIKGTQIATGVGPSMRDRVGAIKTEAAINMTNYDRKNRKILAKDSVRYIGRAKTVIEGAKKFKRTPGKLALLAAAGAVAGHIAANEAGGFLWRQLRLHVMAPLEASAVTQVMQPTPMTCATAPTPDFVNEQGEHSSVLSKLTPLTHQ